MTTPSIHWCINGCGKCLRWIYLGRGVGFWKCLRCNKEWDINPNKVKQ